MRAPDVSVVIPCHNHERYVAAAIESAREQAPPSSLEIIVIDDGSTDGSRAVAERTGKAILLVQPQRRLSSARNLGLLRARGECVIFLDADDMLLEGAVDVGLELLARDADAAAVAGRCRPCNVNGSPLRTDYPPLVESDHYRALLSQNFIWTPGAAMFRRRAVLMAGGFSTKYPASADYALYLRLARTRRIVCHDREVLLYRQHGANMSSDPVLMLRNTLAVLDDERAHVPPHLREEYDLGRRAWQEFYGDAIVERMRAQYRERGLTVALVDDAAALVELNPRGFLSHAWRKLTRASRPAAPAPFAVARVGAVSGSRGFRNSRG